MASGNITEYTAPREKITESASGESAFETAGRRVGPLYDQAGRDMADIGKLTEQVIKEGEFVFHLPRPKADLIHYRAGPTDPGFMQMGAEGGGGVDIASLNQISSGAANIPIANGVLLTPGSGGLSAGGNNYLFSPSQPQQGWSATTAMDPLAQQSQAEVDSYASDQAAPVGSGQFSAGPQQSVLSEAAGGIGSAINAIGNAMATVPPAFMAEGAGGM